MENQKKNTKSVSAADIAENQGKTEKKSGKVSKKKQNTFRLTVTAILTALIVAMTFTPIGMIKIGPFELTLLMVPVIIGAITMGPATGAFLGGVFGLMAFITCFTGSVIGGIIVSVSVVRTFIVNVLSRVLAGWLCGIIFKACAKHDKKKVWSYIVASVSGSVLNTIFFLGLFALLFLGLKFTPEQAAKLGGADTTISLVIGIAAGLNAPIEAVVCAVLGSAVGKAVGAGGKKYLS